MISNYYYIDGSSLISQIKTLRKSDPSYKDRNLDPVAFIKHLANVLGNIGMSEFKRAVFYFPKGGEEDTNQYIEMGKFTRTQSSRDIVYKFCGRKIKGSKAYEVFLEGVPEKFRERCDKSEKGVDIEICCDALKLAATDRMERLIILTNDSDFIPLLKTLKDFGVNVGLIHLSGIRINKELEKECDSCDIVESDNLTRVFVEREVSTKNAI